MTSDKENEPKQGARKKTAKPTGAQLAAALHESERRLHELTDQCLGFLDELGDAREKQEDRQRLQEKIEGLEQLLADSRHRLRGAGATVLRPTAAARTNSLEVVIWGGVPEAACLASVVESLPGVSITCLVDTRFQEPPAESPEAVQWFQSTECESPAQAWNTGLGASDAAAILFLHAGAVPVAGEWSALPAADANTWAVGPRLEAAGSVAAPFFAGTAVDAPPPECDDEPVAIPNGDPRAFVIVRAAAEGVGPFDQDMTGPIALVEYGRRAARRGYRVVGWPEVAVDVAAAELEIEEEETDRDLLFLYARHEPERLGRALTEAPFLWTMEPPARTALFDSIVRRVPGAHLWPEAQRIATAVAEGAVRATLSPEQFAKSFDPLLREKLDQLSAMDVVSVHELWPELIKEDLAPSETFQRLEALCTLEQNVRELLAVRVQGLTAELTTEREARDEDANRIESLEGTLASIAEAINMMGTPHPGKVRERLAAMQADATRLTQLLEATNAPDPGSLIQTLYNLRQQLAERESWIVTLLRQLQKRRLAPFPIKLQQHELDFIARVDGNKT